MSNIQTNLENASKQIISGIVPNAAKAVKSSREFPTCSTPSFVYYYDDPKYRAVMNANSNKIISMIQDTVDIIDGNVNIMDFHKSKPFDDKFITIMSANDRIIDRLTAAMDEEESRNENRAEESLHKELSSRFFEEGESPRQNFAFPTGKNRLYLPKSISRPQNLFTVKPDNSATMFLPILKSKPNAIVALEDCNFVADPETGDYDHPYYAELLEFEKTLDNYKYVPSELNTLPPPLQDTPFEMVSSVDALEKMLKELSAEQEIAVDLEHHSYRTYLGITCLMQISTHCKDYVVDALALRDFLECLNEVFTNPAIVKILHGSDQDLMWLQRDFGLYMVNLFDTGQASRVLQFPRFSLAFLLFKFVGMIPDKTFQLADWRISKLIFNAFRLRPLTEELLEYARTDTHYLLYIAEKLRALLHENNLLIETMKRSNRLCQRIYKKPKLNPFLYLEKAHGDYCKRLNKRQIYALKHLCILRDSIARKEDEGNGFVLPNHMLHNIAQRLPKDSNGVLACCNPIPIMVYKYLSDFHQVICDARDGKHVEKEIDEDLIKFEAKMAEQESAKLGFSSVTASRSVPHEKSAIDNFPSSASDLQSYPVVYNFGHLYNSPFINLLSDSERDVVHKVVEILAPVQVSDRALVEQDSMLDASIPSPPAGANSTVSEDPLYKPPDAFGSSSGPPSAVKLTIAEEVEVESLGAKFCPRSAGRSAQSHAMANLVRRRQQRERHNKKVSKQNQPTGVLENGEASEEDDVVILRDLKIERTQSPGNQSPLIDLTAEESPSFVEASGSAHRSKIPKTPKKQEPQFQNSTPLLSRRRARGGRKGGGHSRSGGSKAFPHGSAFSQASSIPQNRSYTK